MTDKAHLLHRITKELPSMSSAEGRVAKVILESPEAATSSSIAHLAAKADVSEPSVNRFCKKFGASGFPDFKLKLAQALVSGVPYLSQSVELGDNAEAYTRKIFDSTLGTFFLVRDSLDVSVVEQAVDQLIQARRIHFFGLGASSSVAKDAEHKFFRFNLPVSFHEDVLMQRMLASAGGADDLFFIISYTGRTTSLVETAQLAVDNGATVIGLTAPNSPLANVCQLVLEVDVPEDTDHYMPMTSRLVQLIMLDILATGVTLRRGPKFEPHLRKIKESLKSTRQIKG